MTINSKLNLAHCRNAIKAIFLLLFLYTATPLWGADIALYEQNPAPKVQSSVLFPMSSVSKTDENDLRSLHVPPMAHANQYNFPELKVELPFLDWPYNTAGGGRFPSMRQSLAITKGFYEAAHYGIQRGLANYPTRVVGGAILIFDILFEAMPLGDAWLHEEYHRAVLGNRGINSYNDVYKLDLGASVIAVSHVTDEDLIRLKREHPADQVRLSAAGIEGEYLLVRDLEKDRFFSDVPVWNLPLYWLIKLNSIAYVTSGTLAEINTKVDQSNEKEGANVQVRDFTGHDFTAWVYDLHRPDEPYEARGIHPSGVGIDRYIKPSDLTLSELDDLRRQGRLSWLNLLDPNLFGLYHFTAKSPIDRQLFQFNMSMGHTLTSFGHTLDLNLFFKRNVVNGFLIGHYYVNGERWFPGITAELLRYPLTAGGRRLLVSGKIASWLQPKHQRFDDPSASFGGLAAAQVTYPLGSRVWPYLEVEGKTAGWVAGNVYLDTNVSVRMGLLAFFF